MIRPTLLLLHGWGFDASVWDDLVSLLPDFPVMRWDRGYFGTPLRSAPPADMLAVGHSLGAMILARELPAGIPLVAINGFDRFTGEDAVAPRLVERMRVRFDQAPATVLNDFRRRCGAETAMQPLDLATLADDLALLGRTDLSPVPPRRILALQGGEDPILPPELRAHAFAGAAHVSCDDGGHLLPRSHPQFCAAQIGAFAWV